MNPIVIYTAALTAVLGISWIIQDEIHKGLGYAIGVAAAMTVFFLTINELTKDRR
jgi:hypothetical protein